MADLPALQLFEEIQGLSNSMDFWTKDDLNKNWSLYDDESMDTRDSGSSEKKSNNNNNTSNTFSGKSSPTRDTWDPMLYNINLTTWMEFNMEQEEVQVRQQPVLETPITPGLPGVEELQMFLTVSVEQSRSQHSMSRDTCQDGGTNNRFYYQHTDSCSPSSSSSSGFLQDSMSGSIPQTVK